MLLEFHDISVSCSQALEECKTEPFENHSALEIAEQLTLLDHLVFKVIPYEYVCRCTSIRVLLMVGSL